MQKVRKVKFQDIEGAQEAWTNVATAYPSETWSKAPRDAQGRVFVHCWVRANGHIEDSVNNNKDHNTFSDLKGRLIEVQVTGAPEPSDPNGGHLPECEWACHWDCPIGQARRAEANERAAQAQQLYDERNAEVECSSSPDGRHHGSDSLCPGCMEYDQPEGEPCDGPWSGDEEPVHYRNETLCVYCLSYDADNTDEPAICDACGEPVANTDTACSFYHGQEPESEDQEPKVPTSEDVRYAGDLFNALVGETFYGFNLRCELAELSANDRARFDSFLAFIEDVRDRRIARCI